MRDERAYQATMRLYKRADELRQQLRDLYSETGLKESLWPSKAKQDGIITEEEYSLLKRY